MRSLLLAAPFCVYALAGPGHAHALEAPQVGGKLPLTRGVSQIEGASGAGLAPWALIAGNETEDGVGASAFYTSVDLADYTFTAYGAALGLFDRLEISYAHQAFDTGSTGAALGLGDGFTFEQDVLGAKLRILGDALYNQDSWLPQVALGAQFKQSRHAALLQALGAEDDQGFDYYLTATKIILDQSLLVNATLRLTEANQFGLLGFGGDREDDHTPQFEGSAAYMFSDRLIGGVEYRSRPDNLAFAAEEDSFDVFAAYAVTDNLTLVAGYVDLGSIATFDDQGGAYLSLQVGL
jgi:hypothetical protein